MLVLSRKPGQKIVLGTNITLTVVAAQGGRVTLGVDAPPDVRVLRAELWDGADEPIIVRPAPAEGRPNGPDSFAERRQ